MLTQRQWRATGLITLLGAALMGIGGAWVEPDGSRLFFAVYWTIFILLIAVTFYMVWLDLRYIRVIYTTGKREIYQETLGDEEFRRALQGAGQSNAGSRNTSKPPKDGSPQIERKNSTRTK